MPRAGWQRMLDESGFHEIEIGYQVDTFGEAGGEEKARQFEVYGYSFICTAPDQSPHQA